MTDKSRFRFDFNPTRQSHKSIFRCQPPHLLSPPFQRTEKGATVAAAGRENSFPSASGGVGAQKAILRFLG
jgi:hypothetical protein